MSITSTSTIRQGNATTIAAVSDLSGLVYFFWYLDGDYQGSSSSSGGISSRTFVMGPGFQARVDVLDSTDPAFDPYANAPAGYPGRRLLQWVRTTEDTRPVAHYRLEQSINANPYTVLGLVRHDPGTWAYTYMVSGLDDLKFYQWKVIPVGTNGNDGDALELAREYIVRHPDAHNFSATLNVGRTITYATAGAP